MNNPEQVPAGQERIFGGNVFGSPEEVEAALANIRKTLENMKAVYAEQSKNLEESGRAKGATPEEARELLATLKEKIEELELVEKELSEFQAEKSGKPRLN